MQTNVSTHRFEHIYYACMLNLLTNALVHKIDGGERQEQNRKKHQSIDVVDRGLQHPIQWLQTNNPENKMKLQFLRVGSWAHALSIDWFALNFYFFFFVFLFLYGTEKKSPISFISHRFQSIFICLQWVKQKNSEHNQILFIKKIATNRKMNGNVWMTANNHAESFAKCTIFNRFAADRITGGMTATSTKE